MNYENKQKQKQLDYERLFSVKKPKRQPAYNRKELKRTLKEVTWNYQI